MRMNVSLGTLRRPALVALAVLAPLLLLCGWFILPASSSIQLGVSNYGQTQFENVSVRLCGTECRFSVVEPKAHLGCTVEPASDSSVVLEYTSPTGERKTVELTTQVKRGMYGSIGIIFEDTRVTDGSYLQEWWMP